MGLNKPILQRVATQRNRCRRIVAPKVAGSSLVESPINLACLNPQFEALSTIGSQQCAEL
jgi:hypothetical protein